jgi:hypothetical protein
MSELSRNTKIGLAFGSIVVITIMLVALLMPKQKTGLIQPFFGNTGNVSGNYSYIQNIQPGEYIHTGDNTIQATVSPTKRFKARVVGDTDGDHTELVVNNLYDLHQSGLISSKVMGEFYIGIGGKFEGTYSFIM